MTEKDNMDTKQLAAENADLRAQLGEAEETLRAIHSGEVDALVVPGVGGEQLFTLKGADQSYRTLIEEMSEGALTMTAEGVILYANRRFAEMLKMPLEKVIGSTIHTWIEPDRQQIFQTLLSKGVEENRREQLALAASDGTRVPIQLSVSNLLIDGMPDSYCLVATDLTEQKHSEAIAASEKLAREMLTAANQSRRELLSVIEDMTQAEQALRVSEERFRRAIEANKDGLWERNILTNEEFFSPRWSEIIGYSYDDPELPHSYQSWAERIHPDDRERVQRALTDHLEKDVTYDVDYRHRHKSGEYRWQNSRGKAYLDESGRPSKMVGCISDITERKQAEIFLLKSNRALAALSAANHSLVHSTDELELLSTVCQDIVIRSTYRMAWVGYLEQDAAKTIRPVAQNGYEEGYLGSAGIVWADTEHGRGPTGTAARNGQTQIIQDIQTDPSMLPWRSEAAKNGYNSSISLPLSEAGKVFGVLTIYSGYTDAFVDDEVSLLEEMAGDLTFGILSLRTRHERDLALVKNQEQLVQLQDSLEDTVRAIATIVEMRDPYTSGHQVRVADLATSIAKQMGLPDEQVHAIHLAGVVHDVGKIQVPAEILSKPGKITEIEFSLIKIHPQAGYDILKDIHFPWPIAQMVLQHHERLDGSGYPQGLKGDAILLEARILSVADVVEAIYSHRPYRAGLGIEVALAEITKQRGVYYDSQVVDACLAVFREQHYTFKS